MTEEGPNTPSGVPGRALDSRAMARLALAALVLLGWLAPGVPTPARQERSPRELQREIERLGDETPEALFEELGRQRNAAALRALVEGIDHLEKIQSLTRAYHALRHFVGAGAQERAARTYLADRLKHPGNLERWQAVDALVSFGPPGIEILWETGLETADPYLRARVGKALLPAARDRGDGEALAFLLRTFDADTSKDRDALIEVLRAFTGPRLGKELTRGLSERRIPGTLVAAVLEGLARVPGDDLTDAMVRALRHEDPIVARAAVEALRERGDADARSGLQRLARGSDLELRAAAMGALSVLVPPEERADWLAELAEDLARGDESARLLIVDTIGALRTHGSIEVLIGALPGEQVRDVRQAIASTLRDLTGQDLGDQHAPWARWWAEVGEAFELPTLDAAQEAERARLRAAWLRSELYDFYGLKVESRNVCFVLDLSGSMLTKNPIGLTRLDVARRQLSAALRRLPAGARFAVVFFGSRLETLSEATLVMDDPQRELALQRVQRQGTLGRTAVYDALERAFAYEGIDTIYLLTDGLPSGGKVDDPAEIQQAVRDWRARRGSPLQLNCVSVGETRELLVNLAKDSGGQYVEVDVERVGQRR